MIKKILHSPWPSILWSAIIFVLLAIESPNFSQKPSINIPNLDKLVHAIIFGIFVLFWWYYLNNKWDYKNLAIIIGTISIMYGVGMEYYQLLFTRREFEYADMLADGMGSILASLYCIRAKKSPYGNRGRNQN